MNADVIEARTRFAEAERTPNLKFKSELYFQASKLYLKAVPSVTDDSLKRSLIYLSSTCVAKASNCLPTREVINSEAKNQNVEVANSMYSERVLQIAHLIHLQKAEENVCKISVYVSVLVFNAFRSPHHRFRCGWKLMRCRLFAMLLIWSRLLPISVHSLMFLRFVVSIKYTMTQYLRLCAGFVNPVKIRSRPPSSEQLLRSTFAFNSDLGESFMVLDTKSKPSVADKSGISLVEGGATSAVQPAQGTHDPHRELLRRTGGSSGDAPRIGQQPAHMRSVNHRVDAHIHPPSGRDARAESRQLQNTRSEIENELNNPLVQSYLSTHAPAAMAQSHFDFDNLTQSTISTFNKDTIDNAEGVLNLLQTVRRIGESF